MNTLPPEMQLRNNRAPCSYVRREWSFPELHDSDPGEFLKSAVVWDDGISCKGDYTLHYKHSILEKTSHKHKSKKSLVIFLESLIIHFDVSLTLHLSACLICRSSSASPFFSFCLLDAWDSVKHLEGVIGDTMGSLHHLTSLLRNNPMHGLIQQSALANEE